MHYVLTCFATIFSMVLFAQNKTAESFGFRHLQTIYKNDIVDILIKSKKGDEYKIKPIFLFCQGSLPQPLIKVNGDKTYSVFPFKTDSLIEDYHVVIISKPCIPVVIDAKYLGNNFIYKDPLTEKIPVEYSRRNLLDYYVNRDLTVIDFLQNQPFVSKDELVVAGHSEGSTVAAKLASVSKKITNLIYASGCPFGRIMAMIGQDRAIESDTDSTRYTEDEFIYWENVVNDRENMDDSKGDTYKATYDFSEPPIKNLQKLKIPVLICYGTKDWCSSFNDYLRVEMIRQKKKNFTFKGYIGLEHNFFPLKSTGQPDFDKFNWDQVALDWQKWLQKNK